MWLAGILDWILTLLLRKGQVQGLPHAQFPISAGFRYENDVKTLENGGRYLKSKI